MQDQESRSLRLPLNWLLISLGLLSSGLLVALIVGLQTHTQDALSATAMALAVISFGAQLVLAAADYLSGIRQEARYSSIHRDTLAAIQTLRAAIDSNMSVTSNLSDRFNAEFQTILDHVLAGSARSAQSPHDVKLIEDIGTDLRERALEAAVSAPNSPRSRLSSTIVKILHDMKSTVPNSVSYSHGIISWLQGTPPLRHSAIAGDTLMTREELAGLAVMVQVAHQQTGASVSDDCCYVVLPVKPLDNISEDLKFGSARVTWIERFATDVASANGAD